MYGARKKIITKIDRIFAKKSAFQESKWFSFRADSAKTERSTIPFWPRVSQKWTIFYASMTETICRSPGNIIKVKSEHYQVNLLIPVTPWQTIFLKSHQGVDWCQCVDIERQLALITIPLIKTRPVITIQMIKVLTTPKKGWWCKNCHSRMEI